MSLQQTIQQAESPLSRAFFSQMNMSVIQNKIRSVFRDRTGISIDYQKPQDVMVLMRSVYINYSLNPWSLEMLPKMNDEVTRIAVGQVGTGIQQYISYIRDIRGPLRVAPMPMNTSTYGTGSTNVDRSIRPN
jgi:hypothetical protein